MSPRHTSAPLLSAVCLRTAAVAALCVMSPLPTTAEGGGGSSFAGLTDRAIFERINATCRPGAVAVSSTGAGGLWEAVIAMARRDDGSVTDWFSDSHDYHPDAADLTRPVSGMELGYFVPPTWWGEACPYGDTPAYDLYNILVANSDVSRQRSDHAPGKVGQTTYTNGFWRAGTADFHGTTINVFEPADCYKGDFARAMMYLATVYPMRLWRSHAYLVMADGESYPGFTAYGAELLMAWHRADPVSDLERRRNDEVMKRQSNRNPFVDDPMLAEYVWGTLRGTEVPATPGPSNPVPLKAVYSISADKTIDLFYPGISENAAWTVDGLGVTVMTLNLASIGTGRHELRYTVSPRRGKIIITVTP